MKKSLLALAVVAAMPALAQAQTSNVIMYGRVDLGYTKTSAAGALLNQAQQSGSRFGVRGSENLGGGLFATFQVEHRFNADNGSVTSPRFWHGRSIVGLRGGFGEINLGHNYTPLFWVNLAADPWGYDTVAQISNTQAVGLVRFSNSLEFVTPSMGGLQGRVIYALPETATPSPTGAVRKPSANYGFSAVYSGGPLYVGFGYEKHGYAPSNACPNGLAANTAVCVGQPANGSANNKAMGLTANYNFGPFRLLTSYSQLRVTPVVPPITTTTTRFVNVSGVVPLSKATELRATYGQGKARVGTSPVTATTRDIGFGVHHNLSNRTTLYVDLNQTKPPSPNKSITAWDLGIKHNF